MEQQQGQGYEYGGFWLRFAASFIDGIVIGIPLFIVFFILSIVFIGSSVGFEELVNSTGDSVYVEEEISPEQVYALLGYYVTIMVISIIVPVGYYAGLHSSKWQATVGKKLLGLKVTDIQGNRVSFWRALGRYFAKSFLSGIFMIGYIIAAFTEKKQALHDLIAGTIVVRK